MKGDLESCLTALGKDPDDHRESDITVCYFVTHKLGVKVWYVNSNWIYVKNHLIVTDMSVPADIARFTGIYSVHGRICVSHEWLLFLGLNLHTYYCFHKDNGLKSLVGPRSHRLRTSVLKFWSCMVLIINPLHISRTVAFRFKTINLQRPVVTNSECSTSHFNSDTLPLKPTVKCIGCRPAYFAERLYLAMKVK